MFRKILFFANAIILIALSAACTTPSESASSTPVEKKCMVTGTVNELTRFNGKDCNGNMKYGSELVFASGTQFTYIDNVIHQCTEWRSEWTCSPMIGFEIKDGSLVPLTMHTPDAPAPTTQAQSQDPLYVAPTAPVEMARVATPPANLSELSELGTFGYCTTSFENGVSKVDLKEGEAITLSYMGNTSYEFLGVEKTLALYQSHDESGKPFPGWVKMQLVPTGMSTSGVAFVALTCNDPYSYANPETSVVSNYVINDVYRVELSQGYFYAKLLPEVIQIIEASEFEKWQAAGKP